VARRLRFLFPSPRSFFGHGSEWRELFLEECFALQMHLGMSYSDIRSLPVPYRKWHIKRLIKHFEDKNKKIEEATGDTKLPMGEIGPRKFT